MFDLIEKYKCSLSQSPSVQNSILRYSYLRHTYLHILNIYCIDCVICKYKWQCQLYRTENFSKGQCKSPCADINARDAGLTCQQKYEHIIQVSMLLSVHSLRSMTLAARPLHNVNIIWSLMKLENSRDCSSSAHGGGARLGAGSCCLEWKLASARSGQLKLLPRCGSDLVTNLITDAQQFFSTWCLTIIDSMNILKH